jgi:hypothetical protein
MNQSPRPVTPLEFEDEEARPGLSPLPPDPPVENLGREPISPPPPTNNCNEDLATPHSSPTSDLDEVNQMIDDFGEGDHLFGNPGPPQVTRSDRGFKVN